MIDLYTGNSSNGQRAAIIIEECGLEYRVHKYDLLAGEHRNPEFAAIAPGGAIPVIVDSDGPGGLPLTLAQSCAIILYVAEKTGKFMPKQFAARALAWQWLLHAATDVSAASAGIFYNAVLLPEKSDANGKFFVERTMRYFGDADRQLAQREYLAGDVSVADFALYPVYAVRKKIFDAVGTPSNLARWGERMAARPGVQKGMKAAE
ncbi:MAG: glutathione S-transferase N-terminal domain-containing protein [Vicinamibacterales bacterium]